MLSSSSRKLTRTEGVRESGEATVFAVLSRSLPFASMQERSRSLLCSVDVRHAVPPERTMWPLVDHIGPQWVDDATHSWERVSDRMCVLQASVFLLFFLACRLARKRQTSNEIARMELSGAGKRCLEWKQNNMFSIASSVADNAGESERVIHHLVHILEKMAWKSALVLWKSRVR
jgi:hypothetical protein